MDEMEDDVEPEGMADMMNVLSDLAGQMQANINPNVQQQPQQTSQANMDFLNMFANQQTAGSDPFNASNLGGEDSANNQNLGNVMGNFLGQTMQTMFGENGALSNLANDVDLNDSDDESDDLDDEEENVNDSDESNVNDDEDDDEESLPMKHAKGKKVRPIPARFNLPDKKTEQELYGSVHTDGMKYKVLSLQEIEELQHSSHWFGCYPLNTSKLMGSGHDPTHKYTKLDFTRDDFLTDAVLYNVLQNAETLCPSLQEVSLAGCHHITDIGIYWLAEALKNSPKLKRINLIGCSQVTEKGILSLGETCSSDVKIDAEGTMTSISSSRMGFTHLNVRQCPLLENNLGADNQPVRFGKIVICPHEINTPSLYQLLTNHETNTCDELLFTQNLQLGTWNFSIVELHLHNPSIGFLDHNEGHQILLPFSCTASKDSVNKYISKTVKHFLSQEQFSASAQAIEGQSNHCRWTVGGVNHAELDPYSGTVRFLPTKSDPRVSPIVGMTEAFSTYNATFEAEVIENENIKSASFIEIGLFKQAVIYNRKADVLEEGDHCTRIKVKQGDKVSLHMEPSTGINGSSAMKEATYAVFKNGAKIDSGGKINATFSPFISAVNKTGLVLKIKNYSAMPETKQERKDREENGKIVPGNIVGKESPSNYILDEDSGVIRFSKEMVSDGSQIGLFTGLNDTSKNGQKLAVKLKKAIPENKTFRIGAMSEAFEPLTNGEIFEKSSEVYFYDFAAHMLKNAGNSTPVESKIRKPAVGDTVTVEWIAYGTGQAKGDSGVELTLFINDDQVASFHTKEIAPRPTRLIPFLALDEDVQDLEILNLAKPCHDNMENYQMLFTKEHYLLSGITCGVDFDFKAKSVCVPQELVSENGAPLSGTWKSLNSLTRNHSYFEVKVVTVGSESKEDYFGVGLVHKRFIPGGMVGLLGEASGSTASYFYAGSENFETSKKMFTVSAGDVIRCGLSTDNIDFNQCSGIPTLDQVLPVYYMVNGEKVYEEEFHYRGGGLHPSVSIVQPGICLSLPNIYDPLAISESENEVKAVNGTQFVAIAMGEDSHFNVAELKESLLSTLQYEIVELEGQRGAMLNMKHEETSMTSHRQFTKIVHCLKNVNRFIRSIDDRFHQININPRSEEDREALLALVNSNQLALKAWKPYMYEYSFEVLTCFNNILKMKEKKLVSMDQLIDILEDKGSLSGNQLKRIIDIMHKWGKVFVIKSPERWTVVTDPEWFVGVVNQIRRDAVESGKTVNLPCVHEDMPIWQDRGLLKLGWGKLDKDLMFELLTALLDACQLVAIKAIRRNPGDTKYHLIHPSCLREAPTNVSKYFSQKGTNIWTYKRSYLFPDGIRPVTMATALCAVMTCSTPMVLWNTGCVWIQGPVQLVLNLDSDKVMTLSATCYIGDKENDSDLSLRHAKFTMFSIFHVYADIIEYNFLNQDQVWLTVEERTDQTPANVSVCSQHSWDRPENCGERPPIRVCTLCNRCSARQLSCDFSGLVTSDFRDCKCGGETVCCWDCGICKTCAKLLWSVRSYLRPAPVNRYTKSSKMELQDATTGYSRELGSAVTLSGGMNNILEPVLHNEAHVTFTGGSIESSTKEFINVCLISEHKELLVHAYPGKPMLCWKDGDKGDDTLYQVSQRNEIVGLMTENNKEPQIKSGDTITVTLSHCELGPLMADDEDFRNAGAKTYHFQRKIFCILWQENGIMMYKNSSPEDRNLGGKISFKSSLPVAQLMALRPIVSNTSFAIKILEPGMSRAISIGLAPRTYSHKMQPGWGVKAVAYHADDGGLFHENGYPQKSGLVCDKGDVMSCSVRFLTQCVIVSFAKNKKVVHTVNLEKPALYLSSPLYPMIGMHSEGEKIQLLDTAVWSDEDSFTNTLSDTTSWFTSDLLCVSPKDRMLFPSDEGSSGSTRRTKILLKIASDKPVVFKIKVTNPKLYMVRPNRGVINPGDDVVSIEALLNIKPGEQKVISSDKFLVQWIQVPEDVAKSPIGKDPVAIFEKLDGTGIQNHKMACGWSTNATEDKSISEKLEPEPLRDVASGPPLQPCYCLQVKKNGSVVSSCYVPKVCYKMQVEMIGKLKNRPNFLSFSVPRMPTPVHWSVLGEGLSVLAKLKLEDLEQQIGRDTRHTGELMVKARIERIDSDGKLLLSTSIPGRSGDTELETISFSSDSQSVEPILDDSELHSFTKKFVSDLLQVEGQPIDKTQLEGKCLLADGVCHGIPAPRQMLCKGEYVSSLGNVTDIQLYRQYLPDVRPLKCSSLCWLWTRQQASIQENAKAVKDWSSSDWGLNNWDQMHIFIYLPREITPEKLKYPSLSDLVQIKELAAHQVCKMESVPLTSEMGWMEVLCHKMHLVDAEPVCLKSEIPDKHIFGDRVAARAYCELATNKLRLPSYTRIVGSTPDLQERGMLEFYLSNILSIYASIGQMMMTKDGLDWLSTEKNSFPNRENKLIEYFSIVDDISIEDLEFKDASKVVLGGCKAHNHAASDTFSHAHYEPYGEVVTMLQFSDMADQTEFPDDFCTVFADLTQLQIENASDLECLPSNMGSLTELKYLIVNESKLKCLPLDIGDCPNLKGLVITNSQLECVPESLTRCKSLHHLELSQSCLREISINVSGMQGLTHLDLSESPLIRVPAGLNHLCNLKHLNLSGAKVIDPKIGARMHFTQEQFIEWNGIKSCHSSVLGIEKLEQIFKECCHANAVKGKEELAKLNAHLFNLVPRLGLDCHESDASGGVPEEIFELTSLESLELSNLAITHIPEAISNLINLSSLNLDNCVLLTSLPGSMGEMPRIKTLKLRHCPSLRTPPFEVAQRGTEAVLAFLKRLVGGYTENWRTKLMLVGLGGAGKTSLLRALMSSSHKTKPLTGEEITDGIDIKTWSVTHKGTGQALMYSTWDFAGQTVYYNTHQFFLSKRAIYLLLWTTRLGYEHAGLEFWLSSIKCHAPKAPIFIIGTHCDQVAKYDIPKQELMKRYPQIIGFHFVSSITGQGIVDLQQGIMNATMNENYMGEQIPKVYLNLEKHIVQERNNTSILKWDKIKEFALDAGIFDEKDIRRAIQFLHDLGTVQYFDNEFLRDHVVINPQWIVDVMSCVVSVKDSPIVNGHFLHTDIQKVWKLFPAEYHEWLLRLTEAFDLTFPLPQEPVNLVPCLLPTQEPEYDWPEVEEQEGLRETMILYKFAYLPAGLFNRTQVRLFQFSDGKAIWKHGSLLKKNGHLALIKQDGAKSMVVKVQGPRPENILFLVHETLEGLVAESFHGVTYDYFIPCPDCLDKSGTSDPCLLGASLIREAALCNAPFLQCRKSFHAVSMPILQAIMPPDGSGEFDLHFAKSMRNLEDLRANAAFDIFFCYCGCNIPKSDKIVHPAKVFEDLKNEGYTCWYEEDMWDIDIQSITMALQDSKMIVVFMSTEFEQDERCRNLFLHAKEVLKKPYLLVCVGEDMAWQNTYLGYVVGAQEVFVNMKQIERYPHKIKELKEQVKLKMSLMNQEKVYPVCFVSYCWANSHQAVKLGSRGKPGSLGWGDPRKIKDHLESKGISCWLDVEQAGKTGLFEDISVGIRHCEVILACVSKEYASSSNCMMELRFGTCTLNKPVVMAVVGTGDDWQWGEIGMLMAKSESPRVDFQEENDSAYDRVAKVVSQIIPKDRKPKRIELPKTEAGVMKNIEVSNISFMEEFELAQRKFLRLISRLAEGMDTVPYPRLFILDFLHVTQLQKNVKQDVKHVQIRPKSGRITSGDARKRGIQRRNTKEVMVGEAGFDLVSLDDWTDQTLCAKLLCEAEEGWHVVENTEVFLPDLVAQQKDEIVHSAAPFLGRMFTLLKHSGIVPNFSLSSEAGQSFLSCIESYAVEGNAEVEVELKDLANSYCGLREAIIQADKVRTKGSLERCHMPTGSIRWLCSHHQQANRVTVLQTDIPTANLGLPLVTETDHLMLKEVNALSHLTEPHKALCLKTMSKEEVKKEGPSGQINSINLKTETKPVDQPATDYSMTDTISSITSNKYFLGLEDGETTELKSSKPTPTPRQSLRPGVSSPDTSKLGPNALAKLRASGRVVQAAANWPNQPSSRACTLL